jgi:hypothetical protein
MSQQALQANQSEQAASAHDHTKAKLLMMLKARISFLF